MAEQPTPSVGKLAAGIFLLVLLGTPLTAYLWHSLNMLLHGDFDALALLIAVPVAVLFVVLLRFTWRVVEGWQAEKDQHIGGH